MAYTTPSKNHYTVEQQRDRLPLYLREYYETRQLDRIKIDGNEIQGYFEYSFVEEKTYVKSPERSADGSINNLNSYATFLTPRLVIKYNYMHITDYRTLMNLLNSKNEFVVECYDIVRDKRVVHKMYHAPSEMPNIHQRNLEVLGIKNYTIELIGTNSDLDFISVTYHLNPPTNTGIADQTLAENDVYSGSEIVIGASASAFTNETFGGAYKFKNWNLSANPEDINKGVYIDGNAYAINQGGLVLYAQWQPTTEHILTFNYGVASEIALQDNLKYPTHRQVATGNGIGDLPQISYVEVEEAPYAPPYINGKWYKTPIKSSNSVPISNNQLYWSDRDTTIYLLFDVKSYDLTLMIQKIDSASSLDFEYYQVNKVANGNGVQYGASLSLPMLTKQGYEFDGWYTNSDFAPSSKFTKGTMPPYNTILYARWVAK